MIISFELLSNTRVSTDMCISTLRSVIKYNTPVILQYILVFKMRPRHLIVKITGSFIISFFIRNVPLLIVCMCIFRFSKQEICIKCGH